MKVLTITQPWATMIALGVKRIETRGWPTGYRGPLLIHAGKGLGPVGGVNGLNELVNDEYQPFVRQLLAERWEEAGCDWPSVAAGRWDRALPRGVVVARCRLAACLPMWTATGSRVGWAPELLERFAEEPRERSLGHYARGRYAFMLEDIEPVVPVPLRGALGLFDAPADLELEPLPVAALSEGSA